MSGNILDTDINLIKKEALELIIDLDLLLENNDEILDFKEEYQKRYSYLYKTSTTLYNFIFDGYNRKNFDKGLFQKNLLMMLNSIYKIQTNQMSQHDASVDIGEELASHYIPHLKK